MKCFKTFVCGCMMAVCAASWAADYTWMSSPADALWNTTSLNWNSGEAWVDGNNAIFGSSSSTTVTLEGNRTAADISVNGYTFEGSSSLSLHYFHIFDMFLKKRQVFWRLLIVSNLFFCEFLIIFPCLNDTTKICRYQEISNIFK